MEYQTRGVEDGVKVPDMTENLGNDNDDATLEALKTPNVADTLKDGSDKNKRQGDETEEREEGGGEEGEGEEEKKADDYDDNDDDDDDDDDEKREQVKQDREKEEVTGGGATDFVQEPKKLEELVTEVRVTNYEGFKNFYTDKDIRPIIQTLWGGVSLVDDIHNERKRRDPANEAQEASDQQKEGQATAEATYLHRIRIHSPCILRHLMQASKYTGLTLWRPATFCRPFKTLIHFQPQMKLQFERLEKKWGRVDSSTPMTEAEEEDEKPKDDSHIYLDSKYAFLHMQVYVKFIDDKVMPLFDQFLPALPNNYPKATFADLWYLFREGELLYSPVPKQRKRASDNGYTTNNLTLQASYQNFWRVYSIVTPQIADELDDDEGDAKKDDDGDKIIGSDDDSHEDTKTFRIWCYCIDFDGESYGPVQRQFHMTRFEGERDIKSLTVYPVRFVNDYERLLKTQQESGELFKKYIEKKHLYHSGWTLTCSTTGAPLDEIEKYPEHIDGQVIADFSEAYQTITSWKPEFHNPDIGSAGELGFTSCGEVNLDVKCYASNRKASRHICISLHRFDDIGIKQRNDFIMKDGFLSAVKKGDDKEVIQNLNGDSLAILPKRLVVFSLMQRKFVHVNISSLKTIEQAQVFDYLSIDPRHKRMVRSLVQEHFRKKKQQNVGQEVQYQDLIKGKGTGLVFLLHGVPGVGKTATAEAVALENRKPLFAITCGDLGFEPISLEKNLGRIFRLANLWDCILLLDEADIFFTKRTPSDLQRNALVTVFLRILEYYSGVLFLTTNRVGIIDEAFKSRVHMSLYYPELSMEQYRTIFELNIKRVQQIEAENKKRGESSLIVDEKDILAWCEWHFEHTNDEVGRWNGRQIKNAFQIGASLAHYDSAEKFSSQDVHKPYTLNAYQFGLVAVTTKEFDRYMATTKKGKDSELAKREGVRHDIGASYNYHSESSYGLGGYNGQGQPPRRSAGSPRYVGPQQDYREQARSYHAQEPRRVPDSYGPQLSPQGARMDPNNSYASPRQGERGGIEYERDNRREHSGDTGPPDVDEERYGYDKGARSRQPQSQYGIPPPDDRYGRFRRDTERDNGYGNADVDHMQ